MLQIKKLQALEPGRNGWALILAQRVFLGLFLGLAKPGLYAVQLNKVNATEVHVVDWKSGPTALSLVFLSIPGGLYELIVWNQDTDLRSFPGDWVQL